MTQYFFDRIDTITHRVSVWADNQQQAEIRANCGGLENVLSKEGVELIACREWYTFRHVSGPSAPYARLHSPSQDELAQ